MNKRIRGILAGMGLAAIAAVGVSHVARRAGADGVPAETPMTYAGVLEENGALPSGDRMVRIVLWDHATESGSTNKKCETFPLEKTVVTNGHFKVPLDNACTAAVHDNPGLYIEAYVEGESMGRSRLGAVPYAIEAGRAAAASGALKQDIAALSARIDTLDEDVSAASVVAVGAKALTPNGLYCGATNQVSGEMGGYAGAKSLCEAKCGTATAHMCSAAELTSYVTLGGATTGLKGWYATGVYSTTNNFGFNDCSGFTKTTSWGATWMDGGPSADACNTAHAVLCCD